MALVCENVLDRDQSGYDCFYADILGELPRSEMVRFSNKVKRSKEKERRNLFFLSEKI